ncbi:hypothetical protein WJ95_20255 [Burkholderia ubonensis]|uniref:hypothetical protein n=1 Tax=Burkholderia ubonensis TaxID=101571 RepID=UPI00075504E6|nr:hypothetical protein [Burkholderia ubonensis]KVP84500.1 hypothetical protein WJ95_20255 [Burkholderia ubonensis]
MTEINNTPKDEHDIPIECSNTRKCDWKGMHSDLAAGGPAKGYSGKLKITQYVCPKCGNDAYYKREASTGVNHAE